MKLMAILVCITLTSWLIWLVNWLDEKWDNNNDDKE